MPNRLIHETSPYLRQHAENPVDWYPWGEEALARARNENKPIFLSIGYSACHWCHVMERESFEDPAIAAILNEHFVNIKVDREERPDLDAIYMDAAIAMTGRGGWPLSVFLTPEGVPFYAGTYFPPRRMQGMPSFADVLHAVIEAWRTRQQELRQAGQQLRAALGQQAPRLVPDDLPSPTTLTEAARVLVQLADPVFGGWGPATSSGQPQGPKFPQPMALDFLLRTLVRHDDPEVRRVVTTALRRMAHGGIYDHLGGGFHRYATDAQWLVPHFEKMLYDNAQLARVYLHAWQVTGDPLYRQVVLDTLSYVAREMLGPEGGFYSAQDADSEGEEGRFFLWSAREIEEALGPDAALFKAAYGVTDRGNFEGRNILHRAVSAAELAQQVGLSPEAVEARLSVARAILFERREQRVRPARDEKVLTSWNGLMLAAFAEAGRVLAREDYIAIAQRNAQFLLTALRRPDGRLLHTWKDGEARVLGYLEDYSYLIEGLLTLYECCFDERWFRAARDLADEMIALFHDPAGGFFDTGNDHEELIVRPKRWEDNATPSGNAMATYVLLRLAALTGEERYRELATWGLRFLGPHMSQHPASFAHWLCALDFALSSPKEIAIIGDPSLPDTRALLKVVFGGFRPHQVVAVAPPDAPTEVPLLYDRDQIGARATAYVCQDFTCLLPVTEPQALAAQLGLASRPAS